MLLFRVVEIIVLCPQTGAIRAYADVKNSDQSQPVKQVSWVEQLPPLGLLRGVWIEPGKKNLGLRMATFANVG